MPIKIFFPFVGAGISADTDDFNVNPEITAGIDLPINSLFTGTVRNISKLLWQMLEDMEILAPHLILRTNITNKLIVKGDRDLLIQVLQNLLSNAIKYNVTNGWIEVIAQQTKSTVRVTIINSSQDITLGDRNRLFERFYRGDPTHTHKIEGIGLGLNLACEIVRAHHGELTLDSTSDGKTSFSVSLPIV